MTRKIVRDIALITAELQTALKRETADIIAIGGLLIAPGSWRLAAVARREFRLKPEHG